MSGIDRLPNKSKGDTRSDVIPVTKTSSNAWHHGSRNQAGRRRTTTAADARELPVGRHPHKSMMQPFFIFGIRPDAIKLCPVVRHMKSGPTDLNVRVCITAQRHEMVDQVLQAFNVTPDRDLDIMRPGRILFQSTSRIIAALGPDSTGFDRKRLFH